MIERDGALRPFHIFWETWVLRGVFWRFLATRSSRRMRQSTHNLDAARTASTLLRAKSLKAAQLPGNSGFCGKTREGHSAPSPSRKHRAPQFRLSPSFPPSFRRRTPGRLQIDCQGPRCETLLIGKYRARIPPVRAGLAFLAVAFAFRVGIRVGIEGDSLN